jgi:CspA family cold shock protein
MGLPSGCTSRQALSLRATKHERKRLVRLRHRLAVTTRLERIRIYTEGVTDVEHPKRRESRSTRRSSGAVGSTRRRQGEPVAEGTIKRLADKGFGFIATETGKDVFFHHSALVGVSIQDLREGQRVSFTLGQGPKGPRAEDVRLL